MTSPEVVRAQSALCQALCGKPPDRSRVWYLERDASGRLIVANSKDGETCTLLPEYDGIAERFAQLQVEKAPAEAAVPEMTRIVENLPEGDAGKHLLRAAVEELGQRLSRS